MIIHSFFLDETHAINIKQVTVSKGYVFQMEMLIRAHEFNMKVGEVASITLFFLSQLIEHSYYICIYMYI